MLRLVLYVGLVATFLGGGMVAGSGASHASAQDTADVVFPFTPDPAVCVIEPRSTDELIALWYGAAVSPVADESEASEEDGTEIALPVGSPADEFTRASVIATVTGVFSCFAAGDFARATALFTDSFAQGFAPGPEESEADTRAFLNAPPEPAPAGEVGEILAIAEVTLLNEGRAGSFVVDRGPGGTNVAYAILVNQDDLWLLDEVIDFGD